MRTGGNVNEGNKKTVEISEIGGDDERVTAEADVGTTTEEEEAIDARGTSDLTVKGLPNLPQTLLGGFIVVIPSPSHIIIYNPSLRVLLLLLL